MEPPEAQIKEFWTKCGLEYTAPYWVDSSGKIAFFGEVYSELLTSIDLNNLFRWAVPKVQDKGNQVELLAYEHKGYVATVYKECASQCDSDGYGSFLEPISRVEDEDPALALYEALREVMKK